MMLKRLDALLCLSHSYSSLSVFIYLKVVCFFFLSLSPLFHSDTIVLCFFFLIFVQSFSVDATLIGWLAVGFVLVPLLIIFYITFLFNRSISIYLIELLDLLKYK